VNLVGHVAVALDPGPHGAPSTEFLVGCMLPDLAAIARVRLRRPDGELGRGVEFHHACDAAFHGSEWFRTANRDLRDALVDAGVAHGPARACSHAGVEMLLDGELAADPAVEHAARATLLAVATDADDLAPLAPPETRAAWVERLRMIGGSLDPVRYRDPWFVAERLQRMTSGRRRIELPGAHVDAVSTTLDRFQPPIAAAAPAVVAGVRQLVLTVDDPTLLPRV
jgi:hypothetical protein